MNGGVRIREPLGPVATRPVRIRVGRFLEQRGSPYAFIAPFFVIFATFGLFPLLYTGWVSLHQWDILGTHSWNALGNFRDLMGDPRFWNAFRNTVSIWLLSSVPQLMLALVLAHVLNERLIHGRGFFRMALLVPNVVSVAAVAVIFESIFNARYGIANAVLGVVGVEPVRWEVGTFSSHLAIATMVAWRWTGYNALIYLAAMQAIPRDLYEAAALDGARAWHRLRYVTIPGIRPALIFTVIISTIGGLQIFTEPFLFATGAQTGITGGSARQFQTLTLFMYEQAFRKFEFGYAAAIAWVLFVIVVLASIGNYLLFRRLQGAGSK